MKLFLSILFIFTLFCVSDAQTPHQIKKITAEIQKNGEFFVYSKTRKVIPKYRNLADSKFVDPENGMVYLGNKEYVLVDDKLIKQSIEFTGSIKWIIDKKAEISELDAELDNIEKEFEMKLKRLATVAEYSNVYIVSSCDLNITVDAIKNKTKKNERLVENLIGDLNKINRKYLKTAKKKTPLEQELAKVEAYMEAIEKKMNKEKSAKAAAGSKSAAGSSANP